MSGDPAGGDTITPLQPPSGQYDNLFDINPDYLKSEYAEHVKEILFGENSDATSKKPFPHLSLNNFIASTKAVDLLRAELNKAPWTKKENDLYTLSRTTDLQNFDATIYPILKAFRKFLATKVRDLLMKITGIKLNGRVDVAGSKYEQYDMLLPHDDRMEERKFAFIFYLSPQWQTNYGGNLQLYNSDEQFYPTDVAKKITPLNNSFLFFDIDHSLGHTSWHCVEEVTEAGKARISLNGWFHIDDTPVSTKLPSLATIEKRTPTLDIQYEDVRKWINPLYIAQQEQKAIKRLFANKSELKLDNFLTEEMYKQALAELKSAKYDQKGPVNSRSIFRLDESALSENSAIAQLFRLVRSEAMTLLISQWTGLHLYDLKSLEDEAPPPKPSDENEDEPPTKKAKSSEAGDEPPSTKAKPLEAEDTVEKKKKDVKVVSFINKMSHGCYSLCDDQMAADAENNGFCFDFLIFFMEKEAWDKLAGGYYSYIAVNDPNEILRVHPAPNSVAFVFREPDVLSFIKYINARVGEDCYYVLNCSFFGATSGESDSEASIDSELGEDDDESNWEDLDEIEPEEEDDNEEQPPSGEE
uniref:US12 prolyl 3-hydroxylase n=1 Tax=Panagrolaimus sp. ES5 TaxID=591445 RepID=A0AC34GUQ0_9BILA